MNAKAQSIQEFIDSLQPATTRYYLESGNVLH